MDSDGLRRGLIELGPSSVRLQKTMACPPPPKDVDSYINANICKNMQIEIEY
jgi:hypothetical protein